MTDVSAPSIVKGTPLGSLQTVSDLVQMQAFDAEPRSFPSIEAATNTIGATSYPTALVRDGQRILAYTTQYFAAENGAGEGVFPMLMHVSREYEDLGGASGFYGPAQYEDVRSDVVGFMDIRGFVPVVNGRSA
jgi:hypothetical protein